jgi:membrane protease YdiL (CAAX protease family)
LLARRGWARALVATKVRAVNHYLGRAERDFRLGEFLLVIFIAFSWSIVASISGLLNYRPDGEIVAFNDTHLWSLVGSQLALAPIIAFVLRLAGWRWRDFHVNYSNKGTVAGVVLALLALFLMLSVEWLVGPVNVTPPSASLVAVIVLSLVNPWYEELLVCAFVIESLRKRFGLQAAINVSIALRLSYHLYQGPPAFIVFAVFGLLVTLFYVKTGRLWPVVVAHSILDFMALATF